MPLKLWTVSSICSAAGLWCVTIVTWLTPCCSPCNARNRPVDSSQLCLVVPSLSFSTCTRSLLSTFLVWDFYSRFLWLCNVFCSTCSMTLSSLLLLQCSFFAIFLPRCFVGYSVTPDLIFTALHGIQTRSCDENCVCPSVKRVHCDETEESYI